MILRLLRAGLYCTACGVDVDSEVPERSRKNFDDLFFFLREILNDLFWPVRNKCRSIQSVPADLTISTSNLLKCVTLCV